jgi:hypothetical protein
MEIINSLWFGKIKSLEELTLRSFSKYAEFHLWVYDDIDVPKIKNLVIRNGREILPEQDIFLYPNKMDLPFGGRSIVGFSERFRYKVLYEKGGWWSDLDVTCLKPIEQIKTDYFFRDHGTLPLVGNIIKCPPMSELMGRCYEISKKMINEKTTDWHLAMKILAENVKDLNLTHFIRKNFCNIDRVPVVEKYFKSTEDAPENWHFIHWMNTLFDRQQYASGSFYDKLLKEHNIFAPRIQMF